MVNSKLQQLWGNFKTDPSSVSTFLDTVVETKLFYGKYNPAYHHEAGYPVKDQLADEKQVDKGEEESGEEPDESDNSPSDPPKGNLNESIWYGKNLNGIFKIHFYACVYIKNQLYSTWQHHILSSICRRK